MRNPRKRILIAPAHFTLGAGSGSESQTAAKIIRDLARAFEVDVICGHMTCHSGDERSEDTGIVPDRFRSSRNDRDPVILASEARARPGSSRDRFRSSRNDTRTRFRSSRNDTRTRFRSSPPVRQAGRNDKVSQSDTPSLFPPNVHVVQLYPEKLPRWTHVRRVRFLWDTARMARHMAQFVDYAAVVHLFPFDHHHGSFLPFFLPKIPLVLGPLTLPIDLLRFPDELGGFEVASNPAAPVPPATSALHLGGIPGNTRIRPRFRADVASGRTVAAFKILLARAALPITGLLSAATIHHASVVIAESVASRKYWERIGEQQHWRVIYNALEPQFTFKRRRTRDNARKKKTVLLATRPPRKRERCGQAQGRMSSWQAKRDQDLSGADSGQDSGQAGTSVAGVTIITVGNLFRRKGMDQCIEVVKYLQPRFPYPIKLLIVGDGPARQSLSLQAMAGKPEQIRFKGRVPKDDMPRLYHQADLALVLPRQEAFANTAMEALATGLPVVATDVGAMSEIIDHGRTGFLVPNDNLRLMVDRTAELIGDTALRQKMGREAASNVRRTFDAKRIQAQWIDAVRSSILSV